MSEPTAFKTSDPAVIEWWEQSLATRQAFKEEVDAFEAEHGMGRKAVVLQGWSIHVAGLEVLPSDREDGPPDGWRIVYGKHADWIQPYRRSKAQKAIHEAMPTMSEPRDTMPGFDWSLLGGLPSFMLHEGVAWASILYPERMDRDVWTEVPLSEFYAAKEAHEAVDA
jgi:hypothetical protein